MGTLVLLTAMTVLTLNMFLPGLPAMQADFGVSPAVIGLAISGYMALAGLLQLVIGPLSDRLGRRPVLIAALGVYVLASAAATLAQGIGPFLVARLLQAVAVAGAVLSSAVVRDLFDESQSASKLGSIGAAMAVAPMLAPMLGGLIDAWIGWRGIFVAYSCIGLLALTLAWRDLPETRARGAAPGAAAYGALIGAPAFWAYAACCSFAVGAFYIFLTGAPFVAVGRYGLSSDQIGLGLGSITGGFMIGATLTARLAQRVGPGRMMLAGRIIACAGLTCGLLAFGLGGDHVLLLFGATLCVGLGNGMTLANAYSGAMSIRPELAGTAAGLTGALMLFAGAVMTQIATAWLTQDATPVRLLSLMLISAGLSLLAALAALRWRTGQAAG